MPRTGPLALYLSSDRREAFEKLKGETVVVETPTPDGDTELVTHVVSERIKDFWYNAYDHYIETLKNAR